MRSKLNRNAIEAKIKLRDHRAYKALTENKMENGKDKVLTVPMRSLRLGVGWGRTQELSRKADEGGKGVGYLSFRFRTTP